MMLSIFAQQREEILQLSPFIKECVWAIILLHIFGNCGTARFHALAIGIFYKLTISRNFRMKHMQDRTIIQGVSKK